MASKLLPKLFIGSSVEGLPVAYSIQSNLNHNADVVVWDQGIFALSDTTIESLIKVLDTCDFGIFVFSPDDVGLIKGTKNKIIRDNVLFELGLFIGSLGRNRTFIVTPSNSSKMRIPTDLLGMTTGKYDSEKLEENSQSATAVFCNEVRIAIKQKGFLRQIESLPVAAPDNQESIESKPISQAEPDKNDWMKLYHNKSYNEAAEKINELLTTELPEADIAFFNAMILVCKAKLNPSTGLKAIENHLNENKDSLYAWHSIAFFYLDGALFQKAEKTIEEGLVRFPNDYVLLKDKAQLLIKMGKPINGAELLKPFIGNDELILELYLVCCKEAKIQTEAIESIRLVFVNNTYSEYIMATYAKMAYDEDKHKVALYLYNYLALTYVSNAYYKVMLGNCAALFEFKDIAFKNYKEAEELYKDSDTLAIENIGHALYSVGLYEEAKTYFLKSITLNKNSAYAYKRLSSIIEHQEKEAENFDKIKLEGRIEAFAKPDESSAKVLD